MKKKLFVVVLVFVTMFTLRSFAQDSSRVDVFGGYSLVRGGGLTFNGWGVDGSYNINNWIGIAGSFGGHYNNQSIAGFSAKSNLYTYMFGPRIYTSSGKVKPFGQFLMGGAHSNVSTDVPGFGSISAGAGGFAMALGGGLDYRVSDGFSIRPGELDYLMTRFSGQSSNNLQYSAGIVFHFGSR